MQLSDEQKIGLYITIGAIAFIGIITAVLLPTITTIREAHQEIYNIRTYLEQKYQRTINLRASLAQLDQIRTSVIGLDRHIYTAGNELTLITLFEGLANKHEVEQKITNTNLDAINDQRITMSLTLTGNYENMFSYLHDLEQTDYFISVNRLNLQAANTRNQPTDASLVRMDLLLTLYVVTP